MITQHTKKIDFILCDETREEILNYETDWSDNTIGLITLYRTYLRKIKGKKNTLETWNQCALRVIEGMFTIQKTHVFFSGLYWDEERAQKTAREAAIRLLQFKWTPPGRGLWMMGTDFIWEKGGAALNNCGFISTEDIETDPAEPFTFLMDMSMLGVGVGFDTRGANKVVVNRPLNPETPDIFRVTDDREGWTKSIGLLIESYLLPNKNAVALDTDDVRPYGEPIRGFGGVASGPKPLLQGFHGIRDILESYVDKKLSSVAITDIMNLIGKIVISGNVRRTAEIAFGEPDDSDFRTMKSWEVHPVSVGAAPPEELLRTSPEDYEIYSENMYNEVGMAIVQKYADAPWAYKLGGWRWASNNSIFATVGMDYTEIAKSIGENGEPGLAWLDNMRNYSRMNNGPDYKDIRVKGGNPCLEQSLESAELCCLVETYPSRHPSAKDFYETLKIAYLYAKTVTLVATHNMKTNSIMCRNRRIGTSQSGVIDAIVKFGRHYYQKNMLDIAYDKVRKYDDIYSEWLGIPKSIKVTSIKPSGSVSLLANVSPGIHYPKVRTGYRTMRLSKDSNLIKILSDANYRIESSVTDPHKTVVVYFPILNKEDIEVEEDVTIWEQFTNAAMLQRFWADNQVSITISFKPEEKKDIAKCLSTFDSELKGVSLLPLKDHGYKQAPYIHADRAEVLDYKKQLLPLSFDDLHKIDEGENADSNKFCDGETCLI